MKTSEPERLAVLGGISGMKTSEPDVRLTVPGLPEGVRAVRWGHPRPNEYYLLHSEIGRGDTGWEVLIIEPLEGYQLAYDVSTNRYRIAEKIKPVTVIAEFRLFTTEDLKRLLFLLQPLPGYISSSEKHEP